MSSGSPTATLWLLSFSDPVLGVGWNPASAGGPRANLRRTRVLLDLAGAPDRRMTCVLVAGTKGKGSTAAFLASILSAARIRAGLYTQPHLQSYRERIRVDGRMIGDAAFTDAIAALRPRVGRLAELLPSAGAPTTFELTTALALEHFAAESCTIAVVEVGLGGRYDATNAIDPHVSVITPISHDHTSILGTRLDTIAAEKAGIVRPGRVTVIAPQRRAAQVAIRRACDRTGAEPRDVAPLSARETPSLRGAHQRSNAAAAATAALALRERGIDVPDDAIADGIARLRWPGRFEVLAGHPPLVLDGAHNDASAEALAAALRSEYPRRRVRFVVGLMADKDARAVLRPLLPLAASVETVRAPGARGLPAAALARLVRQVPAVAHDTFAAALSAARAAARERDVVCVTGSLALVGEARDALGLPVVERLW